MDNNRVEVDEDDGPLGGPLGGGFITPYTFPVSDTVVCGQQHKTNYGCSKCRISAWLQMG